MRNPSRCDRQPRLDPIPKPSVPIAECRELMDRAVRSLLSHPALAGVPLPELRDDAIVLCAVIWLTAPTGALEASEAALSAACEELLPELGPLVDELLVDGITR